MSFLSSLFAAVVPMLAYLILIWRLDRHEREPFGKVFKHFLWGALGAVFFGIILSTFLSSTVELFFSRESTLSFIGAVLIAPFAEEIVKALYIFRSYKKDYFDNLTDGLVYGGAIGLGFGMTENLLYFTTYDDDVVQWISIVVTRSIFSAVMHGIATATVGAFLAKAKFTLSESRKIYPIIGLLLAMIFHATWNFSLTFEFTYYLGILFMIFLIVSFFIIFSSSLKNEQRIIAQELSDEPYIWNDAHENENKNQTIEESSKKFVNKSMRMRFVNFATLLAFRKLQIRNCEGNQKERYLSDINSIRDNIKELDRNNREV